MRNKTTLLLLAAAATVLFCSAPVQAKTTMRALQQDTYYATKMAVKKTKAKWVKVGTTMISLDGKNRIKIREEKQGETVETTVRQRYYYKSGRLISVKNYRNGKKLSTDQYEYDQDGKLTRLSCVDNKGKEFAYIVYRYDSNGRLVSENGRMNWICDGFDYDMTRDVKKRSLIKPYHCYYKYNTKGQLRKMIQKFYYLPDVDSDRISQGQFITTYTWRGDGTLKKMHQENGFTKRWKETFYDAKERPTKSEKYNPEGEDGPSHTMYKYEYDLDPEGNVKTQYELFYSAVIYYEQYEKHTYKYNQKQEYSDYRMVTDLP